MTQMQSAGVKSKLTQIVLSQLTQLTSITEVKTVPSLKTIAPRLTANNALSPGPMTLLILILRTKILLRSADASGKDNQLLIPHVLHGQSLKMAWKRSSTYCLHSTLEHHLKL